MIMKIEIIATTDKGSKTTAAEARKTFKEVMKIVNILGGSLVYGKGLQDGTRIILEKKE